MKIIFFFFGYNGIIILFGDSGMFFFIKLIIIDFKGLEGLGKIIVFFKIFGVDIIIFWERFLWYKMGS